MDALALLDRLEALISESARVPLTNKVIINEDDVYALIDDLRATIPEEVKQAKWVVKERDRLLEEARKDAEGIVRDAQSQVAQMIDESSITAQAKTQADEVVAHARRLAQEIRQGANEYAATVLEKLESHLARTVDTVRASRAMLSGETAAPHSAVDDK
ncbi:MAG: ATPase [Firmicutes bacterium]|nr:ATPase [Bacillota bacterium]